ncbi:MAG TPA: class I SAM-dependent methyltransferase [Kineosporiaceae bacterium]|nr:class I SAM-dependent methyltransferase [Kineosporiaceae bacterium]
MASPGTDQPAPQHPRASISPLLQGEILEIGPGSVPFPVAAGSHVTYVDRPVPGGRDANWPELIGTPRGPDGDIDADLDVDGLRALADASCDAVILSHVIEHLANPVAALCEIGRVLRPGGLLVLIVPDRHRTFDRGRAPTPFAHLLQEYRDGVTTVSEEHIREFCAALHALPPIHPPQVRDWHDPNRLDDDLLELHRRRSVHVHCWNPEEFAVLLTGLQAEGLSDWTLDLTYFAEDVRPEPDIEFGFLLRRGDGSSPPQERALEFARRWTELALSDPQRDPGRVPRFAAAAAADLGGRPWLPQALAHLNASLADTLAAARDETRGLQGQLDRAREQRDQAVARLERLRHSRTYRAGLAVSGPLRWLRRPSGS